MGQLERRRLRRGLAARSGLGCCAIALLLGGAASRAEEFNGLSQDIPAQALSEALAAYARLSGLQVVYVSEITHGRRSQAVPAGMPANTALARLLEGTGLQFEFLTARGVRIFAARARARGPPASAAAANAPGAMSPITIEEVVVTATAREAEMSRVPIALTVWTRQELEVSGAKNIATLATLTPGAEFDAYPDYGAGIETNIAIRGVNAKDGSTTAIYIGDTPIPHDRASIFGREYPVLFDLERIEVLRGPQGVLLGEGAEGGAVRFIPAEPSVENWSGFARGELAMTARGAPSYETGAALGGPLMADRLGFRIGALLRRDGGYVDRVNPFTGATVDPNANWQQSQAAKAALTVAVTDSVQLTPSVSYQSIQVHDSSAFFTYLSDPSRGLLKNGKLLQQWDSDRNVLLSVKLAAALGASVNLSIVSSYFVRSADALLDLTNNSVFNWPNPMGGEYPVSYDDARSEEVTLAQHSVSQQLRLSSSDPNARLSWVAGAGYVRSHYSEYQDIITSALADGGSVSGHAVDDRTAVQLAAYGEFDLRLWPSLSVTAGLRVERDAYDSLELLDPQLPLFGAQAFALSDHATARAPRFGLSYQPDAGGLYYASLAQGYRAGGPNASLGVNCPVTTPLSYGADSVWSYELGVKNELFDSRLKLDSSVFHARWRDMQTQIPVPECGMAYTRNVGAAISNGFDLGAQGVLTNHLKVELRLAYADARYADTVRSGSKTIVSEGDAIGTLPLVTSPWSATASADYTVAFASGVVATLHAQDVFHSRNPGPFTSDNPLALSYAPLRRPNPSTSELGFNVSARWSGFELSAFVNNALDSRPTLQRRNYLSYDTLTYATTFRPRTVGISGAWRR